MTLVDPLPTPLPMSETAGQAALVEESGRFLVDAPKFAGSDAPLFVQALELIGRMRDALSTASPAPACASCAELTAYLDAKNRALDDMGERLAVERARAEAAEASLQAQARENASLKAELQAAWGNDPRRMEGGGQ